MIRKPSFWKRFRKRLWKISKWGLGFLGVAIVAGYAYVRYDYLTAADDLEYQEMLAKENGIALNAEELKPQPPVKPEENAAPIYRRMIAAMEEVPKLKHIGDPMRVVYAASEPNLLSLRAASLCLARYSEAIELAQQASNRQRCDFGRDWSNPWTMMFPELANIKQGASLLCARATVRARTGNVEGALKDIEAALVFPQHIEEEKTLISALVAIAIEARTLRAVQEIASFLADDPPALEKLELVLNNQSEIPDPFMFLKTEAYFGYACSLKLKSASDQIKNDPQSDPFSDLRFFSDSAPFGSPTIMLLPPLIESELCERAYAAKCLKMWNSAFERSKNDPDRKLNFASYLDKSLMNMDRSNIPSDQLNRIIFPVFANFGKSFVKRSFYRQSTKAYIELLQYRQRNGAFPKSLKEASIANVEPYGKTILNYRLTDHGFRIYDLGLNGKDDGGRFQYEGFGETKSDDQPIVCFPSWERSDPKGNSGPSRAVTEFLGEVDKTSTNSSAPIRK